MWFGSLLRISKLKSKMSSELNSHLQVLAEYPLPSSFYWHNSVPWVIGLRSPVLSPPVSWGLSLPPTFLAMWSPPSSNQQKHLKSFSCFESLTSSVPDLYRQMVICSPSPWSPCPFFSLSLHQRVCLLIFRERNPDWLPPTCTPIWDRTHNPGVCPD